MPIHWQGYNIEVFVTGETGQSGYDMMLVLLKRHTVVDTILLMFGMKYNR